MTNLKYQCACGETNSDKFYGHKKSICGSCHNKYTLKLGQEKKDKARASLGDKCKRCNYNEFKSGLDIHHLDPSKKDPDFKSMRGWAWSRIEKELGSCILLCRNCHGSLHSKEWNISEIGP